MLHHQQRRVGRRRIGSERKHVRRHDIAHRSGEGYFRQDHPPDQIGSGQDACDAFAGAVSLDHQHRADMRSLHATKRLAQRRFRRADHGRAAQQFAQRRCHRLLGRCFGDIGLLQLLPRQVEHRSEPTRAEVAKRGASLHQLDEALARQSHAERVADGAVGQRHRSIGQQRAHREAIADARLVGDLFIARSALHSSLLDDHAVCRRPAFRCEHDLARSEIGDVDGVDHGVDIGWIHLRERRMRRQQLLQASRDRRCRHQRSSHTLARPHPRSPAHARRPPRRSA